MEIFYVNKQITVFSEQNIYTNIRHYNDHFLFIQIIYLAPLLC